MWLRFTWGDSGDGNLEGLVLLVGVEFAGAVLLDGLVVFVGVVVVFIGVVVFVGVGVGLPGSKIKVW